jgi:hypothetical protein
LRNLSLARLQAEACAQERSFARGEACEQAPGLELFRRAIAEGDDDAWKAIMGVYRAGLIGQAGRHVSAQGIGEPAAVCADLAFERFWRAARAGRLHKLDDLPSIIKYLNLCYASVLLDHARARRRRAPEVSLKELLAEPPVTIDVLGQVVDHASSAELWQAIKRQLVDENERLVAYLSFVRGLTPSQIVDRHADRFQTAAHVYRAKRTIVYRLRNSHVIQRLRNESRATVG